MKSNSLGRISLCFVMGLLVFTSCGPKKPKELPFPELIKMLPGEAVSIAKDNFGITLDYSPASIRQVETILGKISDESRRTKTKEGLRGLSLAFGIYIGEVVRRELGEGHWERDHPQAGEKSMPFYSKKGAIFPVSWCYKRIENGEEDNVWYKYQISIHGEDSVHH